MGLQRWLMVGLGLMLALALPARAENRVALVIGINNYQNVPRLVKAVPDAQAMAAELKTLGFDVTQLLDPTRRQFHAAFSVLTGKLQPGDTMLLHYSGHGVQIDGDNFLLPADIPSTDSGDKEFLKSEAIALSAIVDRFRSTGVRVQILIIDACRDNPFAAGGGTRSVGALRGLAPPAATPKGTFILYSAGLGQSALDSLSGDDREPTSPFTRILLKKMVLEGKSLTDIARELRDEVEAAANSASHEQRPAYYDELSGSPFYFVAPKAIAVAQVAPPPVNDLATELAFWDYIKGASSAELFDVYLAKYGESGQFSTIARIESARLKKLASAAPAPSPAPAPPKTGDAPSRPSFDCALARTSPEIAVCSRPWLSDKDRALDILYRQLLAASSAADAAVLRESQRAWRVQRDSCSSTPPGDALAACVGRAYDARFAQLQRLQAGTGPGVPSFDCTLAKTPVEKQICADATLATKDRQLAALFGSTLASLPAGRRDAVIADQGLWLRQRNFCNSAATNMTLCISDAYDRRLTLLKQAQ